MLNSLIDDSLTGSSTASGRDDGIKDVDQRKTRLATLEQGYRTQVGALDTLKRRLTTTSTFLTQQLARLQSGKKRAREDGRMNPTVGRALKVHARTRVATGVTATPPSRLVVLLHDGAIKAAAAAKTALAQGNAGARSAAICKAISIIQRGLRPVLNVNGGSDMAADLMGLYEYIVNRLLYANLRKHTPSLGEVVHLLEELREAWEALECNTRAVREEQLPQRVRGIAPSHDRI